MLATFDSATTPNPWDCLDDLPNGPDLWRAILTQLPAGGIIAGGAVRDYLLGVEPKDIDVFMPVETYPAIAGFEGLGDDRREEYAAMRQIAIVTRGRVGRYPVDLIGLDQFPATRLELLNTFDFGISRSCFDLALGIIDRPEAARDRVTKTVTLLLTDREERSRARFHRFNERMGGGWTLEIPQ